MYNAVFEADNGRRYVFGVDGDTVFDMDIGNGVTVDIGKSQGFLQIGETVENFNITGKPIEVKGTVYGDVAKKKKEMRNVFAPFVSGKLTIQGKYYIRVYVQDTPSFSAVKNDGRFTMVLFAPYPFFYDVNQKVVEIGETRPMFRFPINYSIPHKFGERNVAAYVNVLNDGDIKAPFEVFVYANGKSTNVKFINIETLQYLKLNGALDENDIVRVYRDEKNVLRAELKRGDSVIDILSWIDEGSELFELNVGTNLISASDDEGGLNIIAKIVFNPVAVAVYED